MTDPEGDAGRSRQDQIDPARAAALTELGERRAAQGMHARVYVRDGMTAAMVHRDGDTGATIDEALVEGADLIETLAAEIAEEMGLPDDWLAHTGGKPTPPSAPPPPPRRGRLAAACDRIVRRVVKTAVRLAGWGRAYALEHPDSRVRRHLGQLGIRTAGCIVKVARRLPSPGKRPDSHFLASAPCLCWPVASDSARFSR